MSSYFYHIRYFSSRSIQEYIHTQIGTIQEKFVKSKQFWLLVHKYLNTTYILEFFKKSMMLLRKLRTTLSFVQSSRFLQRNVKLFSTTDSGPEDKGPAKKAKLTGASAKELIFYPTILYSHLPPHRFPPHCFLENDENDKNDEPIWNLGESMKFVEVTEFKGETRIDIREYYVDRNTMETKPGKKGISLNCKQYQKLKTLISEIDQKLLELDEDDEGLATPHRYLDFLDTDDTSDRFPPHCFLENDENDKNDEPTWNLGGGMKFVKVTEFKGETRIDIRAYYVDKNTMETKPGKRGISLNCEQFQKLKTLIPEIDQKLLELYDDDKGDNF